jgi:phosphate transport system substrate-binding protein
MTRAPALVLLAAVAVATLSGQAPNPAENHDAFAVQQARTQHVTSRGKKRFYTHAWDLAALPPYVPGPGVSGIIRTWGLNYLADGNLGRYWEDGFRRYHPGVRFDDHLYTALVSVAGLSTGVADLAASRKITFDDLEGFERIFQRDPVEIVMVTGSYDVPGWANALGIFVHRDNPISHLTLKQLDGIFGAARTGGYQGTTWHPEVARSAAENIRTWDQLGLTGEWVGKRIHVYGLNLRYHQQIQIEDRVFHGGDKWNEDLREYANYAKPDGTIGIAANELMKDLSRDRYGIAYSGIQNLTAQTKVVALANDARGPYIDLTIENVQNRTYPLIGEEYWYFDRPPGRPIDPKLKEFLRYTLSREGQEAVVRDGKFLALTPEVVAEQLRKLE